MYFIHKIDLIHDVVERIDVAEEHLQIHQLGNTLPIYYDSQTR